MAYRPFAVAGTAAPVVVVLPLDIAVAVEHVVEGLAVAIAALPPCMPVLSPQLAALEVKRNRYNLSHFDIVEQGNPVSNELEHDFVLILGTLTREIIMRCCINVKCPFSVLLSAARRYCLWLSYSEDYARFTVCCHIKFR